MLNRRINSSPFLKDSLAIWQRAQTTQRCLARLSLLTVTFALASPAGASKVSNQVFHIGLNALKQPRTWAGVELETREEKNTVPTFSATSTASIHIGGHDDIVTVDKRIVHLEGEIKFGEQGRRLPPHGLAGPAVQHLYAMISDVFNHGAAIRKQGTDQRPVAALIHLLQTAKPLLAEKVLWNATRSGTQIDSSLKELAQLFYAALAKGEGPQTELLTQRAMALIASSGVVDGPEVKVDSTGQVAGFTATVQLTPTQITTSAPSSQRNALSIHIPSDPASQTVQEQLFLERLNALVSAVDTPAMVPVDTPAMVPVD